MKICFALSKRITIAAALVALLVPAGFAQKQSRKTAENRSHAVKAANRAAGKTARPRDMPNGSSEVFTDLTIGPGQSINIDSGLDYANTDIVRVSIRSANADLNNLQLESYWSVPTADLYNATEAMDGSTFVFGNVGGAQFCVYGNQFRLVLTNTGSSTINLMQVMLFAPAMAPPPRDAP